MSKIYVKRNALKAILLFAARHDIRYYLNGVCIEATTSTTRLIATNGHILGIHHSKCANEVESNVTLIIPRAAVELLRSVGSKGSLLSDVVLESSDDGWMLRDHTNGIRLGFEPIKGKFVVYSNIVPPVLSGEASAFDPEYVALLGQAARLLKAEPYNVVIGHNGENAAIARIMNMPQFMAILMPLRGRDKPTRPDWLEPQLIGAPEPVAVPAEETV